MSRKVPSGSGEERLPARNEEGGDRLRVCSTRGQQTRTSARMELKQARGGAEDSRVDHIKMGATGLRRSDGCCRRSPARMQRWPLSCLRWCYLILRSTESTRQSTTILCTAHLHQQRARKLTLGRWATSPQQHRCTLSYGNRRSRQHHSRHSQE